MDAQKIARALHASRDSVSIGKLRPEVTARQAEIWARIAAIAAPASSLIPLPAERQKAVRQGPAEVEKLDKERETLGAELDFLTELEREIYSEFAAAERREKAAAIPGAVRRLPGAIKAVRAAHAKLREEVAKLRSEVEAVANYSEVGVECPLGDSECSELLQLRNDIWTPLTVMTLHPFGMDVDAKDQWPLSWPLAFHEGSYRTFTPIRAPEFRSHLD